MVHRDQRKLVQVVAADVGLVAPSGRYVLSEENRPTTVAQQAKLVIPIVDVSRLAMPDDVEEAAKLRSALQSWGLFVVTGHGMPKEFLDEILEATRKFFHLPLEEKQKCGDLLHEYTLESGRVTMDVLKAMAKLLNQEEGFFINMVGERFKSYSRFTYYPPCPRPDLVNGLKPHTDNSVITLLLMDKDVGGLQVLKDGHWVDVPVLGNDLLVVVGKGMEIVSNAIFKAPWHRVVTSADKERLSLAMFYQPEPERIIGPPEVLVHEKRPAMFKKCLVQTLADGYWDAFAAGDRTVDFLNVRINAEADAEL
uniref:Fe2OG dioxygenase domain-containing protein n=1 Tax=Aegilops tauschii subsp. strangulata TaxID=200361 RepID=A0A453L7I1_AEGTS